METTARHRFLDDYLRIRRAEGRGSDDPAYYLALPYRDLSGKLSAQWAMRGRTYRYFEKHLLPSAPSDILDLGAGCGWMSYRLSLRGHRAIAVDLLTDDRDGLRAARHYPPFPKFEAEFDRLPFANASFDIAIYNASLHYSSDYSKTLAEARRCLRPNGRIVILDSPMYQLARTWRNDAPRTPPAIPPAIRHRIRSRRQHRISGSRHDRHTRPRSRPRLAHPQALVRTRLAHAAAESAPQRSAPAVALLDSRRKIETRKLK